MNRLKIGNDFWSGAIEFKHRIIIVAVLTLSLFTLLYIATTIPFTNEEMDELMEQAEQLLEREYTVLDIFINNFLISLMVFIPVIGPIIGGYVIYVTGRLMGALAASTGLPSILLIALTIVTFYGLVEFLAYGTAFTESIVFTYSLFRRSAKREYRWLLISIGATALLLLIAAAIEYFLIQFFGQFYPELEGVTTKI